MYCQKFLLNHTELHSFEINRSGSKKENGADQFMSRNKFKAFLQSNIS